MRFPVDDRGNSDDGQNSGYNAEGNNAIYFPSAMSEAHFGADKTQDRARSIFQKMVIARTDGIGGGVVFHSEELHALGQFASDLLGSYLFWR